MKDKNLDEIIKYYKSGKLIIAEKKLSELMKKFPNNYYLYNLFGAILAGQKKMDEAIIKRFYRLFKAKAPEGIMPMSIHKLGNSSVATVPTLFDLIRNNKLEDHQINKGDVIIFASVGAGMHINAIVYRY